MPQKEIKEKKEEDILEIGKEGIEKDTFFGKLEEEFLKQAKEAGFTKKQAEFLLKKCKRSEFDVMPF